jgi:hypothetical protein
MTQSKTETLTARLRDYSPENRAHIVHEAADEIDRLRAVIREYLAAYDSASDPLATGSTCRLIRAEGELRAIGEPSQD